MHIGASLAPSFKAYKLTCTTQAGDACSSEDFTGTMASRPSPGLPEYTQHRTRLTGSLDESWCWSPINGLTATEAELNATCTQFYVDPVDTDHACKLRGRLHAWLLGVLSGHEGEQRLRVQKHSGAVYCCPGLASA